MTTPQAVPMSVYLHVPFCRVKCTYCAFNTYTNLDALFQPFTLALAREAALVGASQPNSAVGTIFFGGGTPSVLTPAQMAHILEALHRHFDVAADAEISLEVNPADVDKAYLSALRGLGFNRISIGMQSANAHELTLFNRRHDNDAVVRAVSAARAGGFDNINLDLIYGVPHQSLDDWQTSLRQMLVLQPEHVSLYALTLEDDTPMQAWVERGRLPAPDDDLAADMYELATGLIGAAGYAQYEISNWAKPGRECRHNLQYWYNLPYVGLGPGAHGFAGGVRYATLLSPQRYMQALQPDQIEGTVYPFPLTPAVEQSVVVDRETEIAETLIMTLRLTRQGVDRAAFRERFGADLVDLHRATIERFAGTGLLEVDDVRVRLTEQGRLLSNMVFRELV